MYEILHCDYSSTIQQLDTILKTHEEQITKLINSFGETATDSLTAAGIFGVYKEKMMIVDNAFSIFIIRPPIQLQKQ